MLPSFSGFANTFDSQHVSLQNVGPNDTNLHFFLLEILPFKACENFLLQVSLVELRCTGMLLESFQDLECCVFLSKLSWVLGA